MIEPLEARIAPASIVTVTDLNGDLVKFSSSVGDLTGHITVDHVAADGKHNVYTVAMNTAEFDHANLSITVKKAGGGDAQAIIGLIAGPAHLGTVNVAADLGRIGVGSGMAPLSETVLKALTVASFGRFGEFVAAATPKHSVISGSIGALTVKGDLNDVLFEVAGTLAKATIGGSILGGDAGGGGELFAGEIGKVSVKGDVRGGLGEFSGSVIAGHNFTSIKVGGGVIGGAGENSGNIMGAFFSDGRLGSVTIGGSLQGGSGDNSGAITRHASNLTVGSVMIGGDVIGASSYGSGSLVANLVDHLTIRGSLIGGSFLDAGNILVFGPVKTLQIMGGVLGGSGKESGHIEVHGAIDLLKIGRDLRGGSGDYSGNVTATGGIGRTKIGGVIAPGVGSFSGRVTS